MKSFDAKRIIATSGAAVYGNREHRLTMSWEENDVIVTRLGLFYYSISAVIPFLNHFYDVILHGGQSS